MNRQIANSHALDSATITQTLNETVGEAPITYTVSLNPRPHVSWEESVVDNEFLRRKKSKKCYIFHSRRNFGESSSESESEEENYDKKGCSKSTCKGKTHQHVDSNTHINKEDEKKTD